MLHELNQAPVASPGKDRSLRTHTVIVRMTEEEHAHAMTHANFLGISMSRLMRSRVESLPPPRVDLAVATELASIGSNLNQIVRTLHSGFGVRADALEVLLLELRDQLADLRGQLRRRS